MSEPFSPGRDSASFGHHFLVGLQPSPVLTDHDKRLLSALRPAGVVLFKDNFRHDLSYAEWLEIHARQVREVRECIGRERILVSIDHEGGRVLRTPEPITPFGPAALWADAARSVGGAMGRELRSLGVNLDFAPVADINLNRLNQVIGDRALGTDAETVAGHAQEFLDGLEAERVLGCIKHFPGHGATESDSHDELPVVTSPLEVLREREFVPFRRLIERGVDLVMTAHILFPGVDPDEPATLSRRILEDVLRGELGYDGAVVTDDIGMRAIAERFREPPTAALALASGCDLISICAFLADTSLALQIARNLCDSWSSGEIPTATLERSHGRIAALLERAPQHPVERLPVETLSEHRHLAPLRGVR